MANNHEFTSAYSYSIRYAQWKYRWWSSTTDVWRIKFPFQSIDLQLIFLLRVFRVNYLLFVYLTQRVQKRIREKCVSGREKETIERMYVRVYCFYDSLLLLLFFVCDIYVRTIQMMRKINQISKSFPARFGIIIRFLPSDRGETLSN